ncbi:MAG TPA: patatin-like phospholipase family protein [Polyangia bacterium]|nr:patatin-like phospholipase family protein [Polyangia bacterium]
MARKRRIAIACQGGGSQCAFVAGALDALFERGVQDRYDIVGLSGTSGGAITASLAWLGLLKRAQGDGTAIGARILACWRDLSAQTPQEIMFDRLSVEVVRAGERGLFPTWAVSPSSRSFQAWSRLTALMVGRPEFTDLHALLVKHIDFAELPALVRPDSPVLLVGAGDVLDGTFKIFSSALGEIKVEALLASAAIPNLFPAVWVDGHAYWDGIFASNPPVFPLLRHVYMGGKSLPEEIWVVQVNPTHSEVVPEVPSDISDRRNQLAGNISLQHELQIIEMVNLLLEQGALTAEFRARFGLDMVEPIAVRFIRMSPELLEHLDYPSKLSRQPAHIERLVADGEVQAREFLARIGDLGGSPEPPPAVPVVESVGPGLAGHDAR